MAGGIISSSSRSSSSSSVLSHNPRRTMEEVWKDINLNSFHQDMPATPSFSLHHHHHHQQQQNYASIASNSGRGVILQEFLSGAWKEPNRAPARESQAHPHTALSLNSGQLLCDRRSNSSRAGIDASFFDAHSGRANGILAPPGMVICPAKHSLEDKLDGSFGNDDDRRKKRMIKNRESAARSRARKQAYTNELERGVAQLVSENRRLERQCEELRVAMAAQAHATRSKLQKTSSAPF